MVTEETIQLPENSCSACPAPVRAAAVTPGGPGTVAAVLRAHLKARAFAGELTPPGTFSGALARNIV